MSKIDDTIMMLGTMSQEELSEVADQLIWLHEGRARILTSFLEFAAQDKDLAAMDESFYNPMAEF